MTVDSIKKMIQEYRVKFPASRENIVKFNNSLLFQYEIELLKDINAITDRAINSEYPVVKVSTGYEERFIDLGGNLRATVEASNEFNLSSSSSRTKEKSKATVEYVHRAYSLFSLAKKELMEDEIKSQERKDCAFRGIIAKEQESFI